MLLLFWKSRYARASRGTPQTFLWWWPPDSYAAMRSSYDSDWSVQPLMKSIHDLRGLRPWRPCCIYGHGRTTTTCDVWWLTLDTSALASKNCHINFFTVKYIIIWPIPHLGRLLIKRKMLDQLIKENDVWFPDAIGHHADDVDSGEFTRIPL